MLWRCGVWSLPGLGMVTPLACGVEETWARLIAGQSGAGPITRFDAAHLATRIACEVPYGDGSDGTFNADDWMAPKDQRKVDAFILFGVAAAEQALRDAGWTPEDEEDRQRTGRDHRFGDRRAGDDRGDRDHPEGEGAAAGVAVLHPGQPDQPRVGAGVDPLRLQGAEPLGGHRLLDRRARDRRRVAADPARRRRCDGGRRRRGGDLRARDRRVQRLQGAVDRRSTTSRSGRAGPTTRTATGSSWARARAWWCSRSTSTRRRAARRSMPR